jgi:GntR family transcriptional regulator
MIDWEPGRPKWIQVAEILRKGIETGAYAPGQVVPGIKSLVQEYGIAANTARKILAYLDEELGLVKRVPSLGTYVRTEREREEWAKSRHTITPGRRLS